MTIQWKMSKCNIQFLSLAELPTYIQSHMPQRALILSDKHRLSLPTATVRRVWAIRESYINTIKEPTGSDTRWLSDKIMTEQFPNGLWFQKFVAKFRFFC